MKKSPLALPGQTCQRIGSSASLQSSGDLQADRPGGASGGDGACPSARAGRSKELVAGPSTSIASGRTIHFSPINCAAIPRRVWWKANCSGTGSALHRGGPTSHGSMRFERRQNGGTLFLDEIGDMPLAAQAKILRFLEDQTFQAGRRRQADQRTLACVCWQRQTTTSNNSSPTGGFVVTCTTASRR